MGSELTDGQQQRLLAEVDPFRHRRHCAGACCWASSSGGRSCSHAQSSVSVPHRARIAQPGWCDRPRSNSTRHWAGSPSRSRRRLPAGKPRRWPSSPGGKERPHRSGRPHAEGDRCHQHGRGAAEMLQGSSRLRIHTGGDRRWPPPQPPRAGAQVLHRTRCARRSAPPPCGGHRLQAPPGSGSPAAGAWRSRGLATGRAHLDQGPAATSKQAN